MIVDASAVVAMAFGEPDAEQMAEAITLAGRCRISVVNWLEVVIRLDRKGDQTALAQFEELERLLDIEVVAATPEHAQLARAAYRRFGKGSGSPAQLNFGDCMAYALAKQSGEPLLSKGHDFSQTDIAPALQA